MPFFTSPVLSAIQSKPNAFITHTAMLAANGGALATPGEPTYAEFQAAVTAAGLTNAMAFYNGTDIENESTATHRMDVDSEGIGLLSVGGAVSADLNFTVSDETGSNGAGATTPASPPTPTPDIGDVHKEIYDDVQIYFTATAADWTAPAVVEVPKGASLTLETLTITSRNTISPLAFTPLSAVEFKVNGLVTDGITNVATAITVNPAVVGFNIDPIIDTVTAQYSR